MTGGRLDFAAWVAVVLPPDPLDDTGTWPAGTEGLLREVYERDGPVDRGRFRAAWRAREDEVAGPAMAAVAADVARTTGLGDIRPCLVDDVDWRAGKVDPTWRRVSWRGRHASTTWGSLTFEDALLEVADFVQEEVIEELWTPWPTCSGHAVGLHPLLLTGRPVWFCRAGGHAVAEMGRLGVR